MYCESRFQHVRSYSHLDTNEKILTIDNINIPKIIKAFKQEKIEINPANSRVLFRFLYTDIAGKQVPHESMAPLTTRFYIQPPGGITGYRLSAPYLELEMLDYVPPQRDHDHCSEVRLISPHSRDMGICYKFTFEGEGVQGDEHFRRVKKVIDDYHRTYEFGKFPKIRISKATKKDRELFGLKPR